MAAASDRSPPLRLFDHGCVRSAAQAASTSSNAACQGSRARSSPTACALERAEVIERRTGPKGRTLEYRLTPGGRDLEPVVQAIGEWGATWSFTEPRPDELDPDLLIVWMARHVDRQRLPPDRTVVQFDFRAPKRRFWMVLEPSEVSVCLQHPGFDVDLEVIVDTATPRLPGRAMPGGTIRGGQLTLSGPRALQRGFGHWFTWSAFAPASRSRRSAAQPPHAWPALIAYESPNTAIRAPHRSGRNRHARIRVRARISADRRVLLPRTICGRGVPADRNDRNARRKRARAGQRVCLFLLVPGEGVDAPRGPACSGAGAGVGRGSRPVAPAR